MQVTDMKTSATSMMSADDGDFTLMANMSSTNF